MSESWIEAKGHQAEQAANYWENLAREQNAFVRREGNKVFLSRSITLPSPPGIDDYSINAQINPS
jgi:hypothetical protein